MWPLIAVIPAVWLSISLAVAEQKHPTKGTNR